MLTRLSIRNVVLIDRLDLDFHNGLMTLTGETGAGKSILLDALGLALGLRAEARLLRKGADKAAVTAVFDVAPDHAACQIAEKEGIEIGDEDLLLRRVLGQDGRTRAFINDQSVSIALLKRVGEALVEIHGQFDTQRLLDPSSHRDLLDAVGHHQALCDDVAQAYSHWRVTVEALEEAERSRANAAENEEFLRYAVDELNKLNPRQGEEEALSEQRKLLQSAEQITEALDEASKALGRNGGIEEQLLKSLRLVGDVQERAAGKLDDAVGSLERAADGVADAIGFLERASSELDMDPADLEAAESRLFEMRAIARKHGVEVSLLPDLKEKFQTDLENLDNDEANFERLRKEAKVARDQFVDLASKLSEKRKSSAKQMGDAVCAELAPLKLGAAIFSANISPVDEANWSAKGVDKVAFQVATNPGAPAGPINKIASGGELARFMLALKVILANADPVPVLVFDEVDAGIGGAVASAVGERLAKLGQDAQVLVVTHSPQVAAQANNHFVVRKSQLKSSTSTTVEMLDDGARVEEIARMLSGETVTGEARAAANSLIKGAAA